jgi:hypothetical protein
VGQRLRRLSEKRKGLAHGEALPFFATGMEDLICSQIHLFWSLIILGMMRNADIGIALAV